MLLELTGRKARVGGQRSIIVNSVLYACLNYILFDLSYEGGCSILGVGVKSVKIQRTINGEGSNLFIY